MQNLARVAVVGAGRLGTSLARALSDSGLSVEGPLRRGEVPTPEAMVVLLCVPDSEIAAAAAAVPPGPLVGHCSGATGLEPLGAHRAFSMHPLMTIPAGGATDFHGAPCAVEGDEMGVALAQRLGMRPIRIDPADRAAYHAAASMASNFLIILEDAAERVGRTAGLSREDLLPIVRASVDNWARLGPEALTGPITRGDTGTIAMHRGALSDRAPDLLPLYDAMVQAGRR